jgi:hypothetical protein
MDNLKKAAEAVIDSLKNMGKLSAELEKELRGVIEEPYLPETWIEAESIMNPRLYAYGAPEPYCDAFKALSKLIIIRDAYWKAAGDWRPDWKNIEDKYTISFVEDILDLNYYSYACKPLAFPTEEQRDHFAEHHIDLINQAKPLL